MTWCDGAAAFEGFGRRLPKAPPCSCTGFQTRSQLWGQHEHRLSRLLKRAEKHFNYWLNLAGHFLKTGFLYILSCSSTRSSFLILIFFLYGEHFWFNHCAHSYCAFSKVFLRDFEMGNSIQFLKPLLWSLISWVSMVFRKSVFSVTRIKEKCNNEL